VVVDDAREVGAKLAQHISCELRHLVYQAIQYGQQA
jgi:hypothetical protein